MHQLTLDEKLDWIAYRLMRLTISFGEGLNGTEVDEYNRIFKEEKPKNGGNGNGNKLKGLFLSD